MKTLTKSEIVQLRALCLNRLRAVDNELKRIATGPHTLEQRRELKSELVRLTILNARLGAVAAEKEAR